LVTPIGVGACAVACGHGRSEYRIDRLIGIGGMAAVYAATHQNGHRVAMKFLLDRFSDDPEVRHLFSREPYVANQVAHGGAVPVLDDDVDDEGCPFLVMPLLEGRPWVGVGNERTSAFRWPKWGC